MPNVILNNLDDTGCVVDSRPVQLTDGQVSDVISHAIQLAVVLRSALAGGSTDEDINSVFQEFESALESADLVEESDTPIVISLVEQGI